MNTKAIIASTLLTVLFASQSAIAGQDHDNGLFATDTVVTESVMNKVSYLAPTVDTNDTFVSGRK